MKVKKRKKILTFALGFLLFINYNFIFITTTYTQEKKAAYNNQKKDSNSKPEENIKKLALQEKRSFKIDIIQIYIGIIIGLFCSLLAWWILFKGISPKIRFSSQIGKLHSSEIKSGFKYRIKLENYGLRTVIDVKLVAKLSMKGLRKDIPHNWAPMYIPLDLGEIPRIKSSKKGKIKNILIFKKSSKKFGGRTIITLKLNELKLKQNIYPLIIRKKSKSKTLLLEDLLNLGDDAKLEIIGYGYDVYSGARKLFESKVYKKTDIKVGKFIPGTLNIQNT